MFENTFRILESTTGSEGKYAIVVGYDYINFSDEQTAASKCYWLVNLDTKVVELKTRLLLEAKVWLVQLSSGLSAAELESEVDGVIVRRKSYGTH